jgi:hypothetical protein
MFLLSEKPGQQVLCGESIFSAIHLKVVQATTAARR